MDIVVLVAIVIRLATAFANRDSLKENSSAPSLEVSVYNIEEQAVEIDWHSKTVRSENLISCELVYGPVNELDEVQVLSNFLPEGHVFRLPGLRFNVTYHFHMICHSKSGFRYESNILNFTTGSKLSSQNYINILSSNPYKSNYNILARDGLFSEDENSNRTIQSSNVILGAVCGIVGFLIINITVVMVVRQYSHHQLRRRRRRILEIEERDYDEFPYLQRFE
ncbi:uncharacterized protein [Centruroides vittatus]|uniref:uncharacterized protein n=1 Tax=Centruroides vittatus TaxID=120091 RepID=UPI00350FEACF